MLIYNGRFYLVLVVCYYGCYSKCGKCSGSEFSRGTLQGLPELFCARETVVQIDRHGTLDSRRDMLWDGRDEICERYQRVGIFAADLRQPVEGIDRNDAS
jgi:hypothetical protein